MLTQQAVHGPPEIDVAGIPASLQAAPRPLESDEGGIPPSLKQATPRPPEFDEAGIPPSIEAAPGKGPPELEEVDFEIGINNEVIDEILFDPYPVAVAANHFVSVYQILCTDPTWQCHVEFILLGSSNKEHYYPKYFL